MFSDVLNNKHEQKIHQMLYCAFEFHGVVLYVQIDFVSYRRFLSREIHIPITSSSHFFTNPESMETIFLVCFELF